VLANTSGTGVSSAVGGDLEQLAKDIEVHQRIFRGLNLVLEHVKAMDRYLGGIWKEYRTEFQDAQGSYGSFVSTFGRMKSRAWVRLAGRILDRPGSTMPVKGLQIRPRR
jgi:hypothetical protein